MKKPTILFVDDDKLLRRIITTAIGDKDYKILTAQNGEEGLEKFRAHDVHLLIADQKMDGRNMVVIRTLYKRVRVEFAN